MMMWIYSYHNVKMSIFLNQEKVDFSEEMQKKKIHSLFFKHQIVGKMNDFINLPKKDFKHYLVDLLRKVGKRPQVGRHHVCFMHYFRYSLTG